MGKRNFQSYGEIVSTKAVSGFCVDHHAAHGGALIFIGK